MPQSSLIFVVIVAAWVVVLLPLWVANREDVAAARIEDRDSSLLRVLDRRESRVVAPAGRSTAPLLPAVTPPSAVVEATTVDEVITPRRGPGLTVKTPAVVAAKRSQKKAAARRARILVGLLAVTALSWLVVVFTSASFWLAVPATIVLVADLAALVIFARARAAASRAVADGVYRRIQQADAEVRPARRSTAAPVPVPAGPSWSELMDTTQTVEVADEKGQTWTPVPVPRPTYMLKPVVHRSEPAPLEEELDPASAVPEPTSPPKLTIAPDPVPAAEPAAVASSGASGASPRPWENEHTWADDLDLMLARRRAVNG